MAGVGHGEAAASFDPLSSQGILTAVLMGREAARRIDDPAAHAARYSEVIADYERCGQHCCCKQFLKVLKPVSMKAAKTQKATLDPLKISGRCGPR